MFNTVQHKLLQSHMDAELAIVQQPAWEDKDMPFALVESPMRLG